MTILPRAFARAKPCFPVAPRSGGARAASALLAAFACALPSCHSAADAPAARPDASAAVAPAALAPDGDASSMPHGTVRFETGRGPWFIDVELARTPEQHARGLMFRRDLAPDHGMLFLFKSASMQRFWMHNTLLRLDMIFIGEDRSVVGVVANAEPQTDTGREVGQPARYVLEVAGGEAAAHAVGPGTRVQLIGIDE